MKERRTQTGFTLLELMITIAVIGILAAIAYPTYTEQVAKGRRAECRSAAMQTMQQQERYFSQYNTYVLATAGASGAAVRTFSGDRVASSACTVASTQCEAPSGGGTPPEIATCVEVQTNLQRPDPRRISMIFIDSQGRKGCTINGARTLTDPNCWK